MHNIESPMSERYEVFPFSESDEGDRTMLFCESHYSVFSQQSPDIPDLVNTWGLDSDPDQDSETVENDVFDTRVRGQSPCNPERKRIRPEYNVSICTESGQSSHSGNTETLRGIRQNDSSVTESGNALMHHSKAPGCLTQYSGDDDPQFKTGEDEFKHLDCTESVEKEPISTKIQPQKSTETKTLPISPDKFYFACMALEKTDSIKCKTCIERDECKIHLIGEKEDLMDDSLHILEFTNQVISKQ